MATTTRRQTTDWVGQSLKRKEDARLVRGKGKFVDDIKMLGMLHLALCARPMRTPRSPASMSQKLRRCQASSAL